MTADARLIDVSTTLGRTHVSLHYKDNQRSISVRDHSSRAKQEGEAWSEAGRGCRMSGWSMPASCRAESGSRRSTGRRRQLTKASMLMIKYNGGDDDDDTTMTQ